MIIVTGATGQLGSQIVDRAARRGSRRTSSASASATPERAGDLAAAASGSGAATSPTPARSPHAFEGATQVLDRLRQRDRRGGRGAARRGDRRRPRRRRASACSTPATRRPPRTPSSRRCPTTPPPSATSPSSGMPFTALRNGFYASTVAHLLGRALETGELVAPADGPVSWTAHADLAEAAAVILADEGRFDGADAAADRAATRSTSRPSPASSPSSPAAPIRRVVADDDEWVSRPDRARRARRAGEDAARACSTRRAAASSPRPTRPSKT